MMGLQWLLGFHDASMRVSALVTESKLSVW